jgi:hypothetical protein
MRQTDAPNHFNGFQKGHHIASSWPVRILILDAWNGDLRETIKMVLYPNLKVGENERLKFSHST